MVETIVAAIMLLQPRLHDHHALEYGTAIHMAAAEYELDPLLLVSIAFRESSFRPDVVAGATRGLHGEVGMMQVHPRGVALRHGPPECRHRQDDPACAARTAAGYLAHLRTTCPGSVWRWVAAYGMRRCPSEETARRDPATIRAMGLWRTIGNEP